MRCVCPARPSLPSGARIDAAREIARAGVIGALHDHYDVTVGVGTTAEGARRLGREIAGELAGTAWRPP